jgi:hypothetical protein
MHRARKEKRVKRICLAGALLTLGCDKQGGVDASSGVPGALVVSELSAAQLERVCRAHIEWSFAHDSVEDGCTLDAVFETEDLPACKEWVDVCVADVSKRAAQRKRDLLERCMHSELHCDYTVEQYERCYKEEAEEWSQVARDYSCLEAGDYSEDDYPSDNVGSEECQSVLGACYIY